VVDGGLGGHGVNGRRVAEYPGAAAADDHDDDTAAGERGRDRRDVLVHGGRADHEDERRGGSARRQTDGVELPCAFRVHVVDPVGDDDEPVDADAQDVRQLAPAEVRHRDDSRGPDARRRDT